MGIENVGRLPLLDAVRCSLRVAKVCTNAGCATLPSLTSLGKHATCLVAESENFCDLSADSICCAFLGRSDAPTMRLSRLAAEDPASAYANLWRSTSFEVPARSFGYASKFGHVRKIERGQNAGVD